MPRKKKEAETSLVKSESKYFLVPTWLQENQALKMLQRTPQEHRYTRPGKGGQKWEYVTGAYVQKVLNYVFGWNWDFEIIKQELIGDKGAEQVITLGVLTVKDAQGHEIKKTQNGRKDVAYKKDSKIYLDLGNDYKASATDCLKKCASLLGVASDIYAKQEFKEIKQEAKQEQPRTIESKAEPVSSKLTTPHEKALHDLLLYALSKGATKGQEKKFIEETIGETVEWENIKPGDLNIVKTKFMSKVVQRGSTNGKN